MKLKYSKNLEWLLPYLEVGLGMIPEGKKVTRLQTWQLKQRAGKGVQAAIFTNDYKTYRIYLHSMYHPRGEAKAQRFSKIDILGLLAHELAHTLDLMHSPEHKMLEGKILRTFMIKLKKEGYENEETELAS